jgi:hypothetical protein
MNATAIPNAYAPHCVQIIEGKFWLMFYNGGTFEEYKNMPCGLAYDGRTYVKKGWNSDTKSVHYEEGKLAIAILK